MTQDELQQAWDQYLVVAFFKAGGVAVGNVAYYFKAMHGIGNDAFMALKRVPPIGPAWRCNFASFVAGYLPKLNDYFWKHETAPIDKLAAKVSACNVDSRNHPPRNSGLEKAKRQNRRNVVKASVVWGAISRNNELHARRAWNVCK